MSTARYRWWPYVRRMIRDYPALDARFRDLHRMTITAGDSGMPGGGGGRSVERIAIRELPSTEQREYESVRRAAEMEKPETMELIRLCYWGKKSLFLHEAAKRMHISIATAKRWHNGFVRRVAAYYGLLDGKDDTSEPK